MKADVRSGLERRTVALNLDKARWHPSVLPGQTVVVSTVNKQGEPNLAPKSWITMAAFSGPMLAFGCNVEHATYHNIVATGAFVVNIPGEPLAERIWSLIHLHGAERVRQSGLNLLPAERVRPPLVAECRAHLECVFDSVKQYGPEIMIFGKVVAGSIDAACLQERQADQYFALRPLFFLEDGVYGTIDTAKRVNWPWSTEQLLFLVRIAGCPDGDSLPAVALEHLAFLRELRSRGLLLLAGAHVTDHPDDGGDPATELVAAGGTYVVGVPSRERAEDLARHDPLVRAGALWEITPWKRLF